MDKYLSKVENADLVEKHKIPGLRLRRQAEKEAGPIQKEGKWSRSGPMSLRVPQNQFHSFSQRSPQHKVNILFLDLDDKIPSSPLLKYLTVKLT